MSVLVVIGVCVVMIGTLLVIVTQPLLRRGPAPDPASDPAPVAAIVDPAQLQHLVRTLTESFGPRDGAHAANLDRAATYISGELARAGAQPFDQTFSVAGQSYRNVIAHFGPTTAERVVVGAHYDTAGAQPGADDNASAVAGLIALAGLLSETELAVTVELVAFCLEEPPYFGTEAMGSVHHARRLAAAAVPLRAMICLEMIGYFRDEPGSQSYPLPGLGLLYPRRGNYIAVVSHLGAGGLVRRVKTAMRAASTLPVHSINAPLVVPGLDLSDHSSYWQAGFEAVMITDTAFNRNPHYHAATDTWDTLDYERMAQVVIGVHAAVRALAN